MEVNIFYSKMFSTFPRFLCFYFILYLYLKFLKSYNIINITQINKVYVIGEL